MCVMYMFSIEQKVYFGDKHLNSNSTVTDIALGNSLTFRPTVIKAEKHFNIQSLLKIFEMTGKSICIIRFLLALFSLREIQKKRYRIMKTWKLMYLVQCNLHLASCVEADKCGYFTFLTLDLISHWKRNSISLHDHVLFSKFCTLCSHILNYTFNAHRSY